MMHRLKRVWAFGSLVLLIAGCGSKPESGLVPEIPRGETSRSEAQDRSRGSAKPEAVSVRRDLARDGERGGHTLEKHVGRSDDELRQRLDRERNISAASTWTNRDLAEETVGDALRREQNKIQRWEERAYPRANLALHFDAGRVIGRSMKRGDASSRPCTEAVIVLKAEAAGGFYVLTTYPEEQR
jgi:hypothetical protein